MYFKDIVNVEAVQSSKPNTFQIRTRDGEMLFSAPSDQDMQIWVQSIKNHCILHAVRDCMGVDRVKSFVEMGADLNIANPDIKSYPLVALAFLKTTRDVGTYLLSQQVRE